MKVTTQLFMEPIASDGPCAPDRVAERDPAKHAAEWGQKGYAVSFRYYEQDVGEFNGKELKSEKRYDAGEYDLGTLSTIEAYAKTLPNDWERDCFLFNVRNAECEYVAVHPRGAARPIGKDDYVVSTTGVVTKVSDASASEAFAI